MTNLPKNLVGIKPLVEHLWQKGKADQTIFDRCVAVVGSRRMTSYGRAVLEKFIPILVDAGVTIVSGFMYGVDKTAHRLTLDCGGKTIAVLGWGIDWSDGDNQLRNDIERNGLILSEYPNDTKPQLWMFPKRNRIVAGLSHAVLVVEAGEGSGSLITADFAVRYKRPLFAIPGPITAKLSVGTNNLIKNNLAHMALSANDILQTMNWPINSKLQDTGATPVSCSSDKLLKLLQVEPLTADEIAIQLHIPVDELARQLSVYQLKGLIDEIDGKYCMIN